jgi:cytidylate kinase
MSNKIRIAISGKSGCGNSTVSKLLAEKLGINMINYTFHDIARERNLDFKELCRMAETDKSWDLYLDEKQIELAMADSCVLGSRLAIWLLKEADLKVYLEASDQVRASRIKKREGGSPEEVLLEMRQRDEHDTKRYKNLYNIDNNDYRFAQMILDAEKMDQFQIADAIISEVKKRGLI